MKRRLPWWLLVGWAAAVAVAIPLLVWGGVTGVEYLTGRTRYVTAASASISGDLIAVASVNAGRVAALHATAGGTVRQGDALAEVELAAPVRTTSSGTPVLAFLGSTDQQVPVSAPADGVVAAVLVTEGSSLTAGQTILRIVDPSRLRITALVNEADVARVHAGQEADIYLTALDRTVHGVVQAIVPAATSSLASPATSGAEARAATPTTALYPVYIRVDLRDHAQLLGSSADVRIRVR